MCDAHGVRQDLCVNVRFCCDIHTAGELNEVAGGRSGVRTPPINGLSN